MANKKILIIEDDPDICELIRQNIAKENWKTIKASNGRVGLEKISKSNPDMIILDLMLPEIDGKEICRTIKGNSATKNIPIIMLTAKSDEMDRIIGLELGADDYITKPFSPRELILRMKAVFKRIDKTNNTNTTKFSFNKLEIDFEKRFVSYKNTPLYLTKVEFDLLGTLIKRPGIVFSRDDLLDLVLGIDAHVESRTIDMHISNLREKLEDFGKYIESVRGIGYRLSERALK